jgi:hypothetical protein
MDDAFAAWTQYVAMAPAADQTARNLRIRLDARPK